MRTIVVGYDGSECAKRALERAAEICRTGGTLRVVGSVRTLPQGKGAAATVVDPIEAEDCRRALAEARSLLRERGLSPTVVESRGDPARAIVEQARESGADLIVVGTHGRGPVGRSLLGSVSTAVVHHAPCDVLVVR